MSKPRRDSDEEAEVENSGQAFQHDMDTLYGVPEEESEEPEDEKEA
jgi:hypothetical protein